MPWFEFKKVVITLSVEAESEDEAIDKLDSGVWESNQPQGYDLLIDMEAEPYTGPVKTHD